jgi:hypothetical protein
MAVDVMMGRGRRVVGLGCSKILYRMAVIVTLEAIRMHSGVRIARQ